MSNLQKALDAYKNGELIIVTDDADRENEGDLMLLAEKATPEKVAFMVRHTTGILCVAMTQDRARTLRLPLTPLSPSFEPVVEAALRASGLI